MPDSDDVEELGTFDSSGAFVSTKPEDLNNKDNHTKEESPGKPPSPVAQTSVKEESKQDSKNKAIPKQPNANEDKAPPSKKQDKVAENKTVINNNKAEPPQGKPKKEEAPKTKKDKSSQQNSAQSSSGEVKKESATQDRGSTQGAKKETKTEKEKPRDHSAPPVKKGTTVSEVEKEALDRLQESAENMVLAAMTAEEEEREMRSGPPPPAALPQPSPSVAVPLDHENAQKWFYRDPQGDTQGPFASNEMAEWFSAGYFTMDLYVRRGCDDKFSPLGELIKRWGRVPFLPGPSAPPLLNVPPTSQPNLEQMQQLQQHQEQLKALHAQYLLQQQAMQQQLLRQIQMQQIQQIMQHMQENEQYKNLSPAQQKQIAMQLLLKQPPQPVMMPMQQPSKLSPRSPPSEAAPMNDHPPTSSSHPSFHRSMSQPSDLQAEDGSIWGVAQSVPMAQPVPPGGNPPSVWDVIPHSRSTPDMEQERARKEKEELEMRKKHEEEMKRKQEEFLKQQQEELRQQQLEIQREKEEMERKREALERETAIQLQKLEEARRKEEEVRRRKEEEDRMKQQREEEMRKQRQEEQKKREEEMRQRELKRQEDLQRQQQEMLRQQEQRKREMEEMENQKQMELQRRQEQQRQQQEALKKLQQEQLANIQLPSHAQWGSQPVTQTSQKTRSLLEIQEQEERERREKEEIQRRLENERQQMLAIQQQQQQQKSWSSQIFPTQQQNMKTLLEIQEEQRKLEEEKQRKQQQTQAKQNISLAAASAWGGGQPTSSSHWASEGAWGNATRQASTGSSSASNGAGSLGFWDDAIISSKRAPKPSNQGGVTTEFPTLKGQPQQKAPPASTTQTNKAKPSKRGKEEEAVQRLFQGSASPDDTFSQWCDKALKALNTSVDIPTFVAFLKEVESPYEVHDYVRVYVGESKGAQDFAKQFLEKRSQSRNKARQTVEDSIWGPAPARDFRQSGGNQHSESDSQKAKGKKKKKMQKIDSSILGFTCAADPDRINVGEIEADGTTK